MLCLPLAFTLLWRFEPLETLQTPFQFENSVFVHLHRNTTPETLKFAGVDVHIHKLIGSSVSLHLLEKGTDLTSYLQDSPHQQGNRTHTAQQMSCWHAIITVTQDKNEYNNKHCN